MKNISIKEKQQYVEMLENIFEDVTTSILALTTDGEVIPMSTRLQITFVIRDMISIVNDEMKEEGANE